MVENPFAQANIPEIKKYKGPTRKELGITKELERKTKNLYGNTDYALGATFPGYLKPKFNS